MPPDDHETRISRLEFRMDIIADKQEREAGERKEEYGDSNQQQGMRREMSKHDDGHC